MANAKNIRDRWVAWLTAFAAAVGSAGAAAQASPVRMSFQPVATAEACPADRSPIMILGTYHMSNPGLDAVNVEADDVLSPRRQREIAELLDRLARFRPTKVMLEAPYASPVQQQRYEQYLAGGYELGRNEIDQIGFRLARRMGLKEVTPIDFPMFMSGYTRDELDLSRRPSAPASASDQPRQLSEEELRLRRSTISEYLVYINQLERWMANHLAYMERFEDDPENVAIYARTDTLLNWYKRNFRMWANVVRETDRPRDRVLLLVGSGHIAILRQLAQNMPGFCLVEPESYLRE